jgi:putative ABC transport system substrate-binding protein
LCTSAAFAQEKIKIGIINQIDILPFFDTIDGVKKGLAEKGFGEDKVEYILFSVKGNIDSIKDGIDQMRKAHNLKLMVSIGTRATTETLKYVQDIPVVYSCVSYAESINEAGKQLGFANNYTGTLLNAPAEKVIDLALKIKSRKEIGRIGMIYCSKEDNARRDKDNFEEGCRKFGIESIVIAYTEESEIVGAFQKLVDQGIRCILFPKDTLINKHLDELKPIIFQNQIFTLAADTAFVSKGGAVLAFSAPAYKVGMLAGDRIAQILNGKKPADIPPEGLKSFEIWINMAVASKTKIDIPSTVTKIASKVITE